MRQSEFQQEFSGPAALVPGTLRGYRVWKVDLSMTLLPLSAAGAWGETMDAQCRPGNRGIFSDFPSREGHTAPAAGCTCGIYACHSPEDDQVRSGSRLYPGETVFGVIDAWGRVEIGRRGFRAAHARIRALAFALPTQPHVYAPVHWTDRDRMVSLPNGLVVKATEIGKYWSDPKDWQMALRRQYPNVVTFRDRAALVAQFPPIDVSDLLGDQSKDR